MRNPVLLGALALAATATAVYPAPVPVVLALLGGVVGYLVALLAMQSGMLAAALALRCRITSIVIGVGPRVREWSTPTRAVALRLVPVFLSVSVGPGRAPARKRLWTAALCSALAGIGTAAIAVAGEVLSPSPFLLGAAVATALTVGHTLLPTRTANSTSTGWLLVHLPRLTGAKAAQMDAAPAVADTVDAAQQGRLADADRLADHLAQTYPDLRTATAARILVHQAHGRYAAALALAMGLMEDPEQTPAEAAVTFAALAGLAYATAEEGGIDLDVALPIADNALANAETLGYPGYKLDGTRALRALLAGRPAEAVGLATRAAKSTDDVLSRADDLATAARAHMALGDNRSARSAIAEARALAPWWPRVEATRARLDIA